MGSAWTDGWTARRRSRPKSRPGRASGTLWKRAYTGPSPSPPHGRNCGNSTRQMKMDDPVEPVGAVLHGFDVVPRKQVENAGPLGTHFLSRSEQVSFVAVDVAEAVTGIEDTFVR